MIKIADIKMINRFYIKSWSQNRNCNWLSSCSFLFYSFLACSVLVFSFIFFLFLLFLLLYQDMNIFSDRYCQLKIIKIGVNDAREVKFHSCYFSFINYINSINLSDYPRFVDLQILNFAIATWWHKDLIDNIIILDWLVVIFQNWLYHAQFPERIFCHRDSIRTFWFLTWSDLILPNLTWFDILIWYDLIWYDLIWYELIWYELIWFDLIWYELIWYELIWFD